MHKMLVVLLAVLLTACQLRSVDLRESEFVCGNGECYVKLGESFKLYSHTGGFGGLAPYPFDYDASILEVYREKSSPSTIYMRAKKAGYSPVMIAFGAASCLQDPTTAECAKRSPRRFPAGTDDRGITQYRSTINVFVGE